MNKIGKTTVTLSDIATASGYHYSTVSLAIRNDPRLAAGTRKRIQSVARRLGYQPNPLVSLLMARVRHRKSGFRGNLAYVHTAPPESPRLQGQVHRNFLIGATRRAGELGYHLDEFFLAPDRLNARQLTRILDNRGVVGIVVEHEVGPLCPNRRLPFDIGPYANAVIGVPLASPELHYVANDQYMRAILAARKLLALGYRRPGLVIVENFDDAMLHRCSAGFWALQENITGLPRIPICRVDADDDDRFRQWLGEHRPDVVLSSNFNTLRVIQDSGMRVPEDMGWVHLDWLPEFRPATGIYGNSEQTGAAAVDLVVSQLHRGEAGIPKHPICHFVAGTWIRGSTVRRVGRPLNLDQSFFTGGWREEPSVTSRERRSTS